MRLAVASFFHLLIHMAHREPWGTTPAYGTVLANENARRRLGGFCRSPEDELVSGRVVAGIGPYRAVARFRIARCRTAGVSVCFRPWS